MRWLTIVDNRRSAVALGGASPVSSASVQGRATNPHGILVSTANGKGKNVDMGFHLLVICPDGYA